MAGTPAFVARAASAGSTRRITHGGQVAIVLVVLVWYSVEFYRTSAVEYLFGSGGDLT